MSIDFDSLLEGVNKKDMRAWEDLYAGYYAVLCSYVNNILRDRDQAQDIVQEVFGGCLEIFQTVWGYEGIDFLFVSLLL